jgi:hypothetical protein
LLFIFETFANYFYFSYVSTEAVDEAEEDLETETVEPYQYLNGLSIRDLEDLLEDIKVCLYCCHF